jgi:predicted secreted hydrolase
MNPMKHLLPAIFAIISLNISFAEKPDDGWARAVEPRAWSFPRDHGAHPEYKTEWWYFTGNLASEDGRRFGYQFTLFRQGLRPGERSPSRWSVRDVYFGHFAITDVNQRRFFHEEKIDRGALGTSRYSEAKMDLELDGWTITQVGEASFQIQAETKAIGINLLVEATKPMVLHGKKGLSQKGLEIGNASHYYAFTRMHSNGTLRVGQETIPVTGSSWFDHEFSTSVLDANQIGWDWFSLQLSNGEEIMVYQLRQTDGSKDPLSKGSWIERSGLHHHLAADAFMIQPQGTWKSPVSGGTYPSGWTISIPSRKTELRVIPQLENQELNLTGLADFHYWEGTCRIEGTINGEPVTGFAYVELTGYAKPLGGELK